MLNNTSRLMTDRYDYNNLLKKMDWDDLDAGLAYLALLRLDSFLFRKIVLTDAQLLHSRFFLNATSLKSVECSLFDQLPFEKLEIRTRAKSIEKSLLSFVVDSSKPYLKNHLFPSIKFADRVQSELSKVPTSDVRTWKDIPKVLVRCGADKEDAERLDHAWAKIIEVSSKKLNAV